MCPVCLATAALIAGSVTSSGGLAAIAIRKLGGKLSREENGAGEIASNSNHSTE
ncbi:hypothetical protein HDF09_003396 [Edaphobacter lichenicola]|uniref:Uncharacterized protein n=1 Tax=Tunturiibacter empetritectus TaxID=3069691 RepID=A0A7W8IKE5_9BACT|nr:hypothetical protein [Edaphobacter lichenicola]